MELDESEGQSLGGYTMPWSALLNLVDANLKGEPRTDLPLPVRLSQRPVFRG